MGHTRRYESERDTDGSSAAARRLPLPARPRTANPRKPSEKNRAGGAAKGARKKLRATERRKRSRSRERATHQTPSLRPFPAVGHRNPRFGANDVKANVDQDRHRIANGGGNNGNRDRRPANSGNRDRRVINSGNQDRRRTTNGNQDRRPTNTGNQDRRPTNTGNQDRRPTNTGNPPTRGAQSPSFADTVTSPSSADKVANEEKARALLDAAKRDFNSGMANLDASVTDYMPNAGVTGHYLLQVAQNYNAMAQTVAAQIEKYQSHIDGLPRALPLPVAEELHAIISTLGASKENRDAADSIDPMVFGAPSSVAAAAGLKAVVANNTIPSALLAIATFDAETSRLEISNALKAAKEIKEASARGVARMERIVSCIYTRPAAVELMARGHSHALPPFAANKRPRSLSPPARGEPAQKRARKSSPGQAAPIITKFEKSGRVVRNGGSGPDGKGASVNNGLDATKWRGPPADRPGVAAAPLNGDHRGDWGAGSDRRRGGGGAGAAYHGGDGPKGSDLDHAGDGRNGGLRGWNERGGGYGGGNGRGGGGGNGRGGDYGGGNGRGGDYGGANGRGGNYGGANGRGGNYGGANGRGGDYGGANGRGGNYGGANGRGGDYGGANGRSKGNNGRNGRSGTYGDGNRRGGATKSGGGKRQEDTNYRTPPRAVDTSLASIDMPWTSPTTRKASMTPPLMDTYTLDCVKVTNEARAATQAKLAGLRVTNPDLVPSDMRTVPTRKVYISTHADSYQKLEAANVVDTCTGSSFVKFTHDRDVYQFRIEVGAMGRTEAIDAIEAAILAVSREVTARITSPSSPVAVAVITGTDPKALAASAENVIKSANDKASILAVKALAMRAGTAGADADYEPPLVSVILLADDAASDQMAKLPQWAKLGNAGLASLTVLAVDAKRPRRR